VPNNSSFLSLLFSILVLGGLPMSLWAEENVLEQKPPPESSTSLPEEPVEITADYLEHFVNEKQVNAKGNVVVHYQDRTVTADEMKVNTETGQGSAVGNVVMETDKGTHIEAEEGEFNIQSHKGVMFKAKGTLIGNTPQEYYVTGDTLTRLSDTHYKTQEATLTTCTGKLPDWLIEVGDADIIVEDRALFSGGVFKVKGVPIIYIPIGYVPITSQRKTGFLMSTLGTSNLDGMTLQNRFFWAISRSQDATFGADLMENRGVRSSVEYRYTPSQATSGWWRGEHLKDDISGKTFWKIDARHQGTAPLGFQLNARLDRTSGVNFNKTFRNQTEVRTRRSSDSFASLFRAWESNSFDILTRLRESEEDDRDDTFGILPSLTWKTQSFELGRSNFYLTQETSFTNFLLDLDTSSTKDNKETLRRFDIHPQVAYPIRFYPWLQLTPRLGLRETHYSSEISTETDPVTGQPLIKSGFSRESADFQAVLEGPKFNRIFNGILSDNHAFKHVVEPRIQYDYIPGMDRTDRERIRIIDSVDNVQPTDAATYFLTQRMLRKDVDTKGNSQVNQIARFEISQTYDFREGRSFKSPDNPRRPFSNLRFDLDSQLSDNFFFNFDSGYNVYDGLMQTFNVDVGVKLNPWLMLILEKRQVHNASSNILGTVDVTLPKGWNLIYSARFDEFNDRVLEHNGRAAYSDKCRCWGLRMDIIRRRNINLGLNQAEIKILFSIELRGLADFNATQGEQFIHRRF